MKRLKVGHHCGDGDGNSDDVYGDDGNGDSEDGDDSDDDAVRIVMVTVMMMLRIMKIFCRFSHLFYWLLFC